MTPAQLAAIETHAALCAPAECCGLIVDGDYWPCRNIAAGTDHFQMHPEDFAAADDGGTIEAVVHSHPDASARPSMADRINCERTGLPWFIVGWPDMAWRWIEPCGYRAPLIGREFSHGVLDCWTLVRDYYEEILNIELPDFDYPDKWWAYGKDLYREQYKIAGFREIEEKDLQEHDVIVMQAFADVPNHSMIYVGNNMILHHFTGSLSCRTIYGGQWKTAAGLFLRHNSLSYEIVKTDR